MSEALVHVCEHTRAQLLREQLMLSALRDAVRRYREVVCASARALKLVADDRDAYVEELDLDWDFSDPCKTRDLAHWLDHIACAVRTQSRLAPARSPGPARSPPPRRRSARTSAPSLASRRRGTSSSLHLD